MSEEKHESRLNQDNLSDLLGSRSHYSMDLPSRKYKGLCVGSGGIRGLLEVGMLHEFWERKQLDELTHYSGCSIGSVIVSLLAVGYKPVEILTAACSSELTNGFKIFNPLNIKYIGGFYETSILRNKLTEMFFVKLGYSPTFSDMLNKLGKFIIIPSYCLSEENPLNRQVYFSPLSSPDMKLIDAIIYSCNIPIIFERIKVEGKIYIDGAYTSVFPIKELQKNLPNDYILGLILQKPQLDIDTLLGYIWNILLIPMDQQNNLDTLTSSTDVLEVKNLDTGVTEFNLSASTVDKMNMFLKANAQMKKVFELLEKQQKAK